VLSVGQYYIERHYGRGSSRGRSLTWLERLRRNLAIRHARVDDEGRIT
jgi:hypothetical protein